MAAARGVPQTPGPPAVDAGAQRRFAPVAVVEDVEFAEGAADGLVCRVPVALGRLAVPQDDPAVHVVDDDGFLRRVEDRLIERLVMGAAVALADVAHDGGEVPERAIGFGDGRGFDLGPPGRAVAADVLNLVPAGLAAREVVVEPAARLAARAGALEDGRGAREQFIGAIAGQRAEGAVGEDDAVVGRNEERRLDYEHRVGDSIERSQQHLRQQGVVAVRRLAVVILRPAAQSVLHGKRNPPVRVTKVRII